MTIQPLVTATQEPFITIHQLATAIQVQVQVDLDQVDLDQVDLDQVDLVQVDLVQVDRDRVDRDRVDRDQSHRKDHIQVPSALLQDLAPEAQIQSRAKVTEKVTEKEKDMVLVIVARAPKVKEKDMAPATVARAPKVKEKEKDMAPVTVARVPKDQERAKDTVMVTVARALKAPVQFPVAQDQAQAVQVQDLVRLVQVLNQARVQDQEVQDQEVQGQEIQDQ